MAGRFSDIYSSLFFLLLSIFIYISSLTIKKSKISSVGPDILPKIVAVGIGLLAIIQLIKSIQEYRSKQTLNKNVEKSKEQIVLDTNTQQSPVSYKTVLATIGLIVGYIAFMELLGFLIINFLYLISQTYLLSDKNKKKLPLYILISAVVTVSVYFLFRNLFYLMLPTGILG